MNASGDTQQGESETKPGTDETVRESSPFSLSPDALATPLLVAFNLSIFVGLLLEGMPFTGIGSSEPLIAWGANFGPLTLSGEWWRLLVCTFLHGSVFHLAPNLLGLWIGGSLLERHVGSANFLAIYLASAATSGLASLAFSPDGVAFGASGAVLGVFGALAILSFRKPDFVTPPPLVSPFAIAIFVLFITTVLSALHPEIEQAGHLGGFAAGCVMALGLGRSHSRARAHGSSTRLAILSVGFLVFLFVATASLPRHIVVIEKELLRFQATQEYLVSQFNGAGAANDGNGLDLVAFRDLLVKKLLPQSREFRTRIEVLEDLPPSFESYRRTLVDAALAREERFESLADQFSRVQGSLEQLVALEQQIANDYAAVQRTNNEKSLSRDELADLFLYQTVDAWDPIILEMESEAGLEPPLQERLGVLRDYAVLRRQAWDLFVWSIRNDDPELAEASQETHRRASEMVSPWIGK